MAPPKLEMANKKITFKQANLQHCKAATANICRDLAVRHTFILLIQEPWVNNNKIMGFGLYRNRIFRANVGVNPRAAIYVTPHLQAMLLHQFSDRDTTVVRISRTAADGGDLLVASCYMPDTADCPYTDLLIKAMDFSKVNNIPIILGCDANAHHTIWGSTNINPRGSLLLQFIADTELTILNRGRVPTFVTKNREEVLDVTLASSCIVDQISSWKVSLTPSFSDHRCIEFDLRGHVPKVVRYRDPRRTNWEQYRNFLRQHVEDKLSTVVPRSSSELNDAVDSITSLLTAAYEFSCPEVKSSRERKDKLWSREIEELRKMARSAWNKAKKTSFDSDWDAYRT